MAVPKGILKSSQDLRENINFINRLQVNSHQSEQELPKHVNFDSRLTEENCRSVDTMVSLASTAALENKIKLEDINKQPAHVAQVLKRFLRGDWELDT